PVCAAGAWRNCARQHTIGAEAAIRPRPGAACVTPASIVCSGEQATGGKSPERPAGEAPAAANPAWETGREARMSGHWRWTRRADAVPAASTCDPEALDELLGEVRELRLTFVADLSTAAGAVEE